MVTRCVCGLPVFGIPNHPCCVKHIIEDGMSYCPGCGSSNKGWAEFRRRKASEDDLASDARLAKIKSELYSNPLCTVCNKPMIAGQKRTHAVCGDILQSFPGFVAKSKKEK